jgi:hypothetical protein
MVPPSVAEVLAYDWTRQRAKYQFAVRPLPHRVSRAQMVALIFGKNRNFSVGLAPVALGETTGCLRNVSIVAKFVIVGAITVVVVLRVVFLARQGREDRILRLHWGPPVYGSVPTFGPAIPY